MVGAERLIIVMNNILQARMQNTAMRVTRRVAVRSFASSALQPDFKTLWNISIFHRMAYQLIFSMASARERIGRSVMSFHSILLRFFGALRSMACSTVRMSAGYRFCLPIGGSTLILRY